MVEFNTPFAATVVIKNRDFRFLWISQMLSQFSANMMLFIMALEIYKNTGSNTAVSGLFLSFGIPALLFGFIAGAAVDRLNRKKVLLFCDFSWAAVVLALIFASHNLPLVYFLVFLNSLINQLYTPSEAPLIPLIVPGTQIVIANSLFSFAYYSGMAIGFILAGPLLRLLGLQTSLIVLSACFLTASYFVSRLPQLEKNKRTIQDLLQLEFFSIVKKVLRDLKEGYIYIRSTPILWDSMLLLTGTQVIIALLGTLGPGFADKLLNIDVRDASLVIIGPAVVGIISGALWVGNYGYRIKSSTLIKIGILSAGVILMLVSLTLKLKGIPGYEWLFRNSVIFPVEVGLFYLLGVANSLLDVPANSILQQKAEGEMRGRVYGMLAAGVGGVGILPVVLSGILADAIGVGMVILILGLIVFGYGIWRLKYNKI